MNLVVIGAGKVGETLIKHLVKENHDIVLVDIDNETVESIVNRYDVKGVQGGCLERGVLLNAGVNEADFFIACTSRDEVNILCCVLAKKLGAKRTIARVRDPEYFKEMENMRTDLGLDMAFNPEYQTAIEIEQALKFPSAVSVESFARGKTTMTEFEICKGNPIIGKTLMAISAEYGKKILISMVTRGDDVFIPKGDFVIKEGDYIHIIGSEIEIIGFCKKLKIFKPRAKNAFIVGGGKIAYYLAKNLIENKIDVKILESNPERASELSSELDRAIILCGDGSDQEVLKEEGFQSNDACITLTGMDEENVIISLLAKQSGINKVVTKVDRDPIYNMMDKLGLETVVSPKEIIANHIVRFVRAHQAETSNGINTLYKLHDKVEALEFTVRDSFTARGIPLKEIAIKRDVLIVGIVRNGEYILPVGDSILLSGDEVIVVTAVRQITDLSQVLK